MRRVSAALWKAGQNCAWWTGQSARLGPRVWPHNPFGNSAKVGTGKNASERSERFARDLNSGRVTTSVDQSIILCGPSGERARGCQHRPRHVCAKCRTAFWPRHWRPKYCRLQPAAKRRDAGWPLAGPANGIGPPTGGASTDHKSAAIGTARERRQTASADAASAAEGQRITRPRRIDFSAPARVQIGRGVHPFTVSHEQSCSRFCSIVCRLDYVALLDREGEIDHGVGAMPPVGNA